MQRYQTVDAYIENGGTWKEALILLRELCGSTGLEETVKWGMPVYTLGNKNVVGFSAFKAWTGLWFYQGVFLSDPGGMLINAQEGTTKALRQWRFSTAAEIRENRELILQYLQEAIRNQQEGKEIKPERKKDIRIPAELRKALLADPALKDSFASLTPGKQREYAEYIGQAKQAETRSSRLEKILPMIIEGIGLNDKYKTK